MTRHHTNRDFLVAAGSLASCYDPMELTPSANAEGDAENLIKFLFSDLPFKRRVFSKEFFSALLFRRNPSRLKAFHHKLQDLLYALGKCEADPLLVQMQIGLILAVVSFLEPGGSIFIPHNGVAVEYVIERLKLTPVWLGSPLLAFGLTPKDPSQPTILLFRGTPPPTSSGCLIALWTDFVPGVSVGKLAYKLFVKKRIQHWLDKQEKPVVAYGQSLGGALCLLTAYDMPEKISEVHSYNGVAPYFKDYPEHVRVNMYIRENDPVRLLGNYPEHYKIYRVVTPIVQNMFFAHIRSFPALGNVCVLEGDPRRENRSILRPMMFIFHFLISIPIFLMTSALIILKSFLYLFRRR